VLNNIQKFRFEASFKTWISRIAYNQALQFIRKTKSKSTTNLDEMEEIPNDNYDLEESIFKSFEKETIWTAVGKLKDNHKSILLFFYKDQLSIKEICEIQNSSENQVKVSLYRARAELKKILEDLL
jgi:RNA polymerase sigma-70 factor (ECF subfamily)